MTAPAITRVTLFRNTVNDIGTATSFDITSEFLASVTPTTGTGTITYTGANVTRSGLTPGTTYYYWIEIEDQAGLVTDQALGSITTATPAPSPDITAAVDFDGTNDYLTSSGTGYVDSKVGTISAWLRLDSTGVSNMTIFNIRQFLDVPFLYFEQQPGPVIRLLGRSPSYVTNISFNTGTVAQDEWIHVMVSWDNASSLRHFYVNDVSSLAASPIQVDDIIRWDAAKYTVGQREQGTGSDTKFKGCIAEFYATNEYLDLSVEANRRKFISATGVPVSLGADGSTPTGTQPRIYMSGQAANWNTGKNFGSAGDFVVNGAVTDCVDVPIELWPIDITAAVDFDGTTDYLLGTGSSTYDTKVGTISAWFKNDEYNTSDYDSIFNTFNTGSDGVVELRTVSGPVMLLMARANGTTSNAVLAYGSTTLTVGAWHHVVVSWDNAASAFHMYIDDAVQSGSVTQNDVAVRWDESNYCIGARPNNGSPWIKHNGCLAEVYATREYIDLSVEANRRKFISATGSPVSLGADGSLPTGNQPDIYMSGQAANWNAGKNFGSAGDFTVTGAVTDCATIPFVGTYSSFASTISADMTPFSGSLANVLVDDASFAAFNTALGPTPATVTINYTNFPVYVGQLRLTVSNLLSVTTRFYDSTNTQIYTETYAGNQDITVPLNLADVKYATCILSTDTNYQATLTRFLATGIGS